MAMRARPTHAAAIPRRGTGYAARAAEHPDLTQWHPNISPTGQLTPGGRAIPAIHVTAPGDPAGRRRIWFQCTIHAREWISPMVCMYFVNHLVANHTTDTAIQALLLATELIVVPVVNPDGCECMH